MKSIFIFCVAILCTCNIYAQYSFKAIIKDADGNLLQATTANIKALNKFTIADSNGHVIIENIPAGKFKITFSHVGFEETIIPFQFPPAADSTVEIILNETEHEENEVVVTSTRTSRTIANIPARIEIISGEELEDRKSTRLNSSHMSISYAVFC